MLAIRMTRHGTKKRPFFHIVVADSRSPRDGRFIEKLGTYNPLLPREHEQRITLVPERIAHWLKVGAQPSDRVAKFFAQAELMKPRERREQTKKNQPRAKAQVRIKSFTEDPMAVAAYGPLSDETGKKTYRVEALSASRDSVLARIEGVADR